MCCIALIRCMLVLRCAGLCRLKRCFSLHKDTTPPQPNHTVTRTHIEPEQYKTWNKSTIICKLLKMDVLTFETCWAVNSEKVKQVTSSWSIFIQLCNLVLFVYSYRTSSQHTCLYCSCSVDSIRLLLWVMGCTVIVPSGGPTGKLPGAPTCTEH